MIFQFLKKYKRQQEVFDSVDKFGFAAIYNDLISQILPISKIKSVIENMFFPVAIIFSLILTYITIINGFSFSNYILWTIYCFLIYSTMSIVAGWLVGFVSFSIVSKPVLPLVLARMIIAIKSPYTNRYGLNAFEIQRLKGISEIDQASAEWKNGFLSIGILAILFATIQGSSQEILDFMKNTFTSPTEGISLTGIYEISIVFLWFITTVVIFELALSIFSPLVEFLAVEPINRRILNACEEALALLEALNLAKKDSLTIREKNKVAEVCLCQIIPDPGDKRFWDLKTNLFKDKKQKMWLLLPPAALIDNDIKKAEERFARRKRLVERIKKLLSKE